MGAGASDWLFYGMVVEELGFDGRVTIKAEGQTGEGLDQETSDAGREGTASGNSVVSTEGAEHTCEMGNAESCDCCADNRQQARWTHAL